MKHFARLMGLVVFLQAVIAFASGDLATTGQVALLQAGSDGPIRIQLVGTPNLCTGTPPSGAGTNNFGDIQIDSTGHDSHVTTADAVKAMLSLLTAAKLAGKSVTIHADLGYASNVLGCRIYAVDVL